MKPIYTAQATVTGGRDEGHGRTSDGALEVDIRVPSELGGPGEATNPEQLFAVGYASCFESALKIVGRRQSLDVDDVSIEIRVNLLPNPDRSFALGVEMDVTLPSLQEGGAALEVVGEAHRVCPYSNATRGNIDVAITANGQALSA
ncbi:MAG TPA: organic hydroperoxide resistance protein [Solirubrobacterales bacterium]|jgi:Ohr subfamily peroxiredoxin